MISSDPLSGEGQPHRGQARGNAMRSSLSALLAKLRTASQVAQVRLRFVIVFAVAFLVVGKWDTLRAYWDQLTSFGGGDAPQTISSDTEHFCPMCPGVISDWPAKCPVCNMALVRRKKGGAVQLPNGVVSRMQYSPYRLQLAGVRTSPSKYVPLAIEFASYGVLGGGDSSDEASDNESQLLHADLRVRHEDAAMLRTDQNVAITAVARPGLGPWSARVSDIQFDSSLRPMAATVRVVLDEPNDALSAGMEVAARFQVPVANVEPFRSQPTNPEPLSAGERRSVFVCPEHSDVIGEAGGKCPRDGLALVEQPLAENERLRYWCPMHPEVVERDSGHKCDKCKGMILVPRVFAYRPPGEVLVVPENAVIDTGRRHLIYIDRGEGMFDGVEVTVGPRVAGCYSIVSGLQAGQKVASAGAFLLDAETRLNANTSALYFGAMTNPSAASDGLKSVQPSASDAPGSDLATLEEIESALKQLAPEEERLARQQRVCPVTKFPLGSMGKPVRMEVEGRIVFLCCKGCEKSLLKDPAKYLPSEPADGAQAPPDDN
jgi:hypothetical protein